MEHIVFFILTGIIPYFGQQRFSYYLAVVVALLSGFVIVKGFELGWNGLDVGSRLEKDSPFRLYILSGSIVVLFSILFFVVYPFPFKRRTA